jgi:DNA damage-binding protein 1
MQILVASGGGNLIYFEIGRGLLMETKRTKLDYEIACLDINPKGENCIGSNLVAVGVWTDVSIHVYALPSLPSTQQCGARQYHQFLWSVS